MLYLFYAFLICLEWALIILPSTARVLSCICHARLIQIRPFRIHVLETLAEVCPCQKLSSAGNPLAVNHEGLMLVRLFNMHFWIN